MKKVVLFSFLSMGILTSCVTTENKSIDISSSRILKKKISTERKQKSTMTLNDQKITKDERKQQKLEINLIKVPSFTEKETVPLSSITGEKSADKESISLPAEKIQLSIEEMPVYDFLNLIFGKVLKLNYTISPDVQRMNKKVTLNMTIPMKPKDFLSFIIDLLKDYRVEVKYEDGIFKINKLRTSISVPSLSFRPLFALIPLSSFSCQRGKHEVEKKLDNWFLTHR